MGFSSLFTRASADSTANVRFSDVIGSKTDAAAAVGTTKSLVAYAKYGLNKAFEGTQCVEKVDGAVLSGADDLFTVSGGPVIAQVFGIVTTVLGGAANGTLQFTTTTPAATVNISTTVAIDSQAAGSSIRFVGATGVLTPLAAGVKIIDPVTVEDCMFLCPIGTMKFLGSAARSGVIAWYLTFRPLSPNSRVVAAA